jgi:hypothetical protein
MFNPERGDYDALDASRSVLSGSAKPMVNPERGDYDALDASRSVLSGSAKPMVNGQWSMVNVQYTTSLVL